MPGKPSQATLGISCLLSGWNRDLERLMNLPRVTHWQVVVTGTRSPQPSPGEIHVMSCLMGGDELRQ